jgi:hypothetical protein
VATSSAYTPCSLISRLPLLPISPATSCVCENKLGRSHSRRQRPCGGTPIQLMRTPSSCAALMRAGCQSQRLHCHQRSLGNLRCCWHVCPAVQVRLHPREQPADSSWWLMSVAQDGWSIWKLSRPYLQPLGEPACPPGPVAYLSRLELRSSKHCRTAPLPMYRWCC